MHIIRAGILGETLAEDLAETLGETFGDTIGETFLAKKSRRESRIGLYAWLPARLSPRLFFLRRWVSNVGIPFFLSLASLVPVPETPGFSGVRILWIACSQRAITPCPCVYRHSRPSFMLTTSRRSIKQKFMDKCLDTEPPMSHCVTFLASLVTKCFLDHQYLSLKQCLILGQCQDFADYDSNK